MRAAVPVTDSTPRTGEVATMTTDVYVERRWIDIPSVHGMSVSEASDRLTEAGSRPVASPRRFTADAGDIVGGTLPPEGATLRRTARIDLLPAREEVARSADEGLTDDQLFDLGIMPNLAAGYTGEQAIAFVQAHGFHAWPRETWSSTVDPGFVMFTEPRAGTAVNTDPIVIWVSTGPPVEDPPPPPPEPDMILKG
jgi:beta-lactam-binding protein with PASTA domain